MLTKMRIEAIKGLPPIVEDGGRQGPLQNIPFFQVEKDIMTFFYSGPWKHALHDQYNQNRKYCGNQPPHLFVYIAIDQNQPTGQKQEHLPEFKNGKTKQKYSRNRKDYLYRNLKKPVFQVLCFSQMIRGEGRGTISLPA